MRIRAVLQARTSSSRLPAKVLLPIADVAMAILCAKRIARNGLDLVLATSNHPSDDALSSIAEKNQIKVCRGPLENVLERYADAITDLDNNDVVVRVTADNPLVDAEFVDSVLEKFMLSSTDYMATQSPIDGLPYGMSAEVMTVKAIRMAKENATSLYDLEHVTPWIRENLMTSTILNGELSDGKDISHIRCTVDTFDDYINVSKIFGNDSNEAINSSWKLLVKNLLNQIGMQEFKVPYRQKNGTVNSVVALGTVQLGLDYGVANNTGMPDSESAKKIIQESVKYGVNWIDTASAYGLAERRVGNSLAGGLSSQVKVVTKLDALPGIDESTALSCVVDAVEKCVFRSLYLLQAQKIDVFLLHRWEHRALKGGKLWETLLEFKNNNIINELGASIYSKSDAIDALNDSDVSHIQIPFNLLDHRWLEDDFQEALKLRPDVRVHVRSVFLQGLLVSGRSIWPSWCFNADKIVEDINKLVKNLNRNSRADLCVAFILSYEWIDSIVVGVETIDQLHENFKLASQQPLNIEERNIVLKTLSNIEERLIDPSKW